ncbi:putative membrane protein [Cytobacillus horneckiae]|uniref:QueT transporter family protein n=1 Tax=Cytobacillus horneckiae TaxID=549687 RepID=A0A2N0Z8M3_9BACI|nr:QueT transporter family protein [Cytobacillus horneckiae]MBN6886204.1 QueT transporter family protein [Cytobacillus horneckiae]MCM3176503.1 QueT transporter family protein [Cytobacillus horneckiae]MEC1157680.1 QueT transporter family protein [Cytobacillus horneckiae]MED2940739.1 QueT transporter family protein [Cytobacillus horneckiae]PKG25858.1 QueT transporter family protein [Cytobacillus horneckiae]
MNTKTLVANGILAALYIAVSMLVQPIAFSAVQFRIAEMFNHLIIFDKKYIYGIVLGVFLTNLLFSPMKAYDLIFGVGHSIICLLITIFICKFIKNIWGRMIANTIVFTFMMWIIALELKLAVGLPFMFTWATTAIGEFIVLLVGMPLIYLLNKRVNFYRLITGKTKASQTF